MPGGTREIKMALGDGFILVWPRWLPAREIQPQRHEDCAWG
jgi:hypothetical protein